MTKTQMKVDTKCFANFHQRRTTRQSGGRRWWFRNILLAADEKNSFFFLFKRGFESTTNTKQWPEGGCRKGCSARAGEIELVWPVDIDCLGAVVENGGEGLVYYTP